MSGAEFDPTELARLAAISRKWDERVALSHTSLSHDHATLVEMLQDDRRTLDYFTTHRDAIVAAVSRAEAAEAALERVESLHQAALFDDFENGRQWLWCPECDVPADEDGLCPTVAAIRVDAA